MSYLYPGRAGNTEIVGGEAVYIVSGNIIQLIINDLPDVFRTQWSADTQTTKVGAAVVVHLFG